MSAQPAKLKGWEEWSKESTTLNARGKALELSDFEFLHYRIFWPEATREDFDHFKWMQKVTAKTKTGKLLYG